MESLTFFGVSVEYFAAFQENFVNLRSFHFGDTMEFSVVNSIKELEACPRETLALRYYHAVLGEY